MESTFGTKGLLIGGRMQPAASGKEFESFDPATGEVLARLAEGGAADVDAAVRAARGAFEGEWSRWTPHERQKLLIRVHDVIEKHFDELAMLETRDMGAPLARTLSLKPFVLKVILYYATQTVNIAGETLPNSLGGHFATMSVRAPVGVVGGIIPWNAPLMGQWWIVAPALATGCTVVLKPAEDASLSVLRTAELLLEAGVPEGVVNVVTGFGSEAGAALAAHPDVQRVAFTGSVETGRRIVQASTSNLKRLQLELGGKSPDIVFADADLDAAVPGAGMGVFANTGQICYAGTRLFVQRSIQHEFVERLGDFARKLKVGNPLESGVQLGPVISKKQLERVLHYVELGGREGARLVSGGKTITGGGLDKGHFIEPTIFSDVRNDMTIAQEEIFGPVVSVIPFDDADEVLRMANDIDFGLGGAVWTRDNATAMKMAHGIRAGTVWINCYGVLDPAVGFTGTKLSGYGWKGGPRHIDGFLYDKAIYMNLGAPAPAASAPGR